MTTRLPHLELHLPGNTPGCRDCTGTVGAPTVDPANVLHATLEHDASCPALRHRQTMPVPGLEPRRARIDGKPTLGVLHHIARHR
ncbi:hypothetical protein R1CP_23570 [Rhodococcus opacus]|uniref:Uncharacterized protein n=1 Tax=Rhodococcus opacus TaxID=37919 RepID=A0A1B1K9T6_RHOOP|nr:hypothetical protein [Rhodococcus opacus]ANS29382.1 hypothetical protein R1CP_23570 [Rhodococcus opacus]